MKSLTPNSKSEYVTT